MTIPMSQLADAFGSRSDIAMTIVPRLYTALKSSYQPFKVWKSEFSPDKKTLKTDKIAAHYGIKRHSSLKLIYVLRVYYATIVRSLVTQRTGYTIPDDTTAYNWLLNEKDKVAIICSCATVDFSQPVPDALKSLYHDLFSGNLRHAPGEYYTPDWLANFVLDRAGFDGTQRLLDPTCGSGTFLVLAYQRLLAAGIEDPLNYITGIDINPLAVLSAKANLILNMQHIPDDLTLPIYQADVLLNPPDIGQFDVIIGNPPWVNWETLPETYREQTRSLWQDYGLFPHSGFETILGKGKKDLSLVITYAVVDHYLKQDGKLAFILSQSVLKTGGAAEGFRQFAFNTDLQAAHVDDFSKLRIFAGAETKPIVLILSHDAPDKPTYYVWNRPKKTIHEDAPDSIIESMTYKRFIAEPVAEKGSAWLTGKAAALHAVRKIIGQSDYTAHASAYTGGANAVYWLDILKQDGERVYVRNVTQGAKRKVRQVEAWLEAEFVYPLLRGRDVKRWQAIPSLHILIVQNPDTRKGYDETWLSQHYPLTYAYLLQFETILKKRATYKRYFRDDVPFYTMFDIGTYTFQNYKVIWHGFGKKRMEAVVVGSIDGKPITGNQAMHPFIGLDDEDEAHYLAACLNSAPFEFAVLSHTQSGGKSFAQPGILETLRLPQYEAQNPAHRALTTLSREAHQGKIDNDAIARHAASIWGLSAAELRELQDSLVALLS